MASNITQVSQLVERLWSKTQAGELKWQQMSSNLNYQTRLGDFVISLSTLKNAFNSQDPDVAIAVKKLDGITVINASTGSSTALAYLTASNQIGPLERIDAQSEVILKKLHRFLSNRNSDLDALLKLLK